MFSGTSEGMPFGGWIQGATPLGMADWDAVLKVVCAMILLGGAKVVASSVVTGAKD
jgi:hypothetical protein